jgi:hypothetical protein
MDGNIERPEKDYFDLGTKVHMYLLEPKEFDKCYTYLEYDTPRNDKQKQFCIDYVNLTNELNNLDTIIKAYENNYATKGKSKEKIEEESVDLYTSLKKYIVYLRTQDKFKDILNYSTLKFLEEANKQITNHKLANDLLGRNLDLFGDIEDYNEFQIKWKHPLLTIINCVSTLDRLVIDHDNKVIKIIDLKTTHKLNEFVSSFEKFKYYRQLAFYWMAVEYYFKEKYLDKKFEEYRKESYIIAIQTNNSANTVSMLTECEVFEPKQEWLDKGKSELNDLVLPRLAWHYNNDLWDHSREYYEGMGSVNL